MSRNAVRKPCRTWEGPKTLPCNDPPSKVDEEAESWDSLDDLAVSNKPAFTYSLAQAQLHKPARESKLGAMVNILPFMGPAREPAQRRPANGGPQKKEEQQQPGFLQRLAQPRGGGEGGQPRAAGRGIIVPGQQLPHITLSTVQGGKIELGAPTGKWQMIVVYRGKHCPVSKNYLASLQQIIYELDELGVEVIAVSGDGRERAEAFLEALKATTETKEVTFKIAYGLPLDEMLAWGLFVSEPRNIRETDQPFPEPALFLLNPDGEVIIIDYSNSPFARPDLRILVEGIRYIQENDYPVRGTYGYY